MKFLFVRRVRRATAGERARHRIIARSSALLGLPLLVAGCDLVSFIQDPKPVLEQNWNLPADSTTISVASLLPSGVTIYSTPGTSDSSAFQVSVGSVSFSRRVGDDCSQCQTQHGTTAIKPSFVMATGSSSALPANVVSGTLTGGQVSVAITNNLSFDPLRVKVNAPASSNPSAQGRMVIVIRSGSLVVGRDSVNGATTAFAPGSVLNRAIALQSGNIAGPLSVDLTVTSPPSDTPVPINANGLLNATMSVPAFRVASIRVNVVNRPLSSIAGDSIPVADIDENITDHIVGGGLDMRISNPFNIAGSLVVELGFSPGEAITNTLSITNSATQRLLVELDSADMNALFSAPDKVALTVSGSVNSSGPIEVTPKQVITIANRLLLTTRFGTPE